MKDIKALLKEAREAIKNKDFQFALKLSKMVLKEDKMNYMGMIFLGLSLQEIGPIDQTPKAFKKAIDINPSNPLAWQGLINFYEKNMTEKNTELTESYMSILNIESTEKKILEYCKKLANLGKDGDINICRALYNASNKCTEQNKTDVLKILSEILEASENMSSEISQVYDACIKDLLATSSMTENVYSGYISYLNKNNQALEVIKHSIKMYNLFPSNVVALSWICKTFNQLYIEGSSEVTNYYKTINEYVDKLMQLDPKNAMGLFTKAVLATKNNKTLEAKEELIEVTSQRPGLVYAWILLTDSFIKLQIFDEALSSWRKSKKLLQNMKSENRISKKVDYQEVEILSMSREAGDWKKAEQIISQEDFNSKKCLPAIINIFINLEQYVDAGHYISEYRNFNDEHAQLLSMMLLKKQKKYEKALEIFHKKEYNFAQWWMELGLLYWDMQQYKNALEPFIKAAKCDPDSYACFLFLGNYYSKFNQFDKARRCYEKAYKINPKSSETGSALSKVYRKQKNWEANLKLLTSLTTETINNKNMWAWLQLGLTYLEQGDALNSMEYLRTFLRIDPDNIHGWESLGDAYFARGAFTSALKCYQKASELSQCSLYPTLQVAYIKKILGEYPDAKVDFENILLNNGQYIPALKGYAETCLCQAREYYMEQRLGTARDYAQLAANKITLAILQRSELSCLWKMLADCCFFTAKLPEKYCCLRLSKDLLDTTITDADRLMEKEELFSFATKCYCTAVSLIKDNPFLWHDLGTCYLTHAYHTQDEKIRADTINFALAAAYHCTNINPGSWSHWNLLGNIALFKDPPNYALAQHSFIKSVIANRNSAVAWTNLGILYLLIDDIKLANKSFSEGQRADPNYVNSWIGQAIIAETLNHSDAMDLFRHSTQLGQHQQGSLGYGHWVCHVLLSNMSDNKTIQYSINNMHAIPVACDAVNWYTEKNPDDGCAWNILGILYERMGLKSLAKEAFRNAFMLCEKDHRDKARINYGRLLYQTENYKKAIEMFSDVKEATFSSGSGLALALFRDGQYEESYAAYEQALHWLTEEQTFQSDLLVALASMAYKFQGPDAAKTLLFQSINLKPPSPWSLYSTFSLALLHKDLKLAKLVLHELISMEKQENRSKLERSEYIYHYSTLLSYFYLLKGEEKDGITSLSKLVHRQPNETSTWLTLSQFLFRQENDKHLLKAAASCSKIAMKLGQRNLDLFRVLCLAALSFCKAGDTNTALVFVQKAAHSYPQLPETWALLASVLATSSKHKLLPSNFFKKLHSYFIKTGANENILSWSNNHLVII